MSYGRQLGYYGAIASYGHDDQNYLSGSASESSPSMASEFTQDAIAFNAIESSPVVSGAILNPAFQYFSVEDINPSVLGVFYTFAPNNFGAALVDTMPAISGFLNNGSNNQSGSLIEPVPSVLAVIATGRVINFSLNDTAPQVNSSYNSYGYDASFDVVEDNSEIYATIVSGKFLSGSIYETSPYVSATINDNAYEVVEPQAQVISEFAQENNLYGIAIESKPAVNALFVSEKVSVFSIREASPSVSANLFSQSQMVCAVSESQPALNGFTIRGAIVTGNVIDITPILNARHGYSYNIDFGVIEAKTIVYGRIDQRKSSSGRYLL
jgi:hypothetical protein